MQHVASTTLFAVHPLFGIKNRSVVVLDHVRGTTQSCTSNVIH